MPDVTSIAAALSSFNTLKNIAQAMVNLHDAQALQLKIIEFNGQLIDAQTKIFAVNEERTSLVERVGELEKQLAELKAWDAEKQRYELKEIAPGSFAYALKPTEQNAEPPHKICANCYQKGEKSILQKEPGSSVQVSLGIPNQYICPRCKAKVVMR